MNTTENKKSIAKFMNYANNKPLTDALLKTLYNDWNSLMPVVEKIESLDYFKKEVQFSINKYSVCIQTISKNSKVVLSDCVFSKWGTMGGTEKTKAIYNACLEFINWYNQKKN